MADEEFDFDALEARIQAAKQAKGGAAPPTTAAPVKAPAAKVKPVVKAHAPTPATPRPAEPPKRAPASPASVAPEAKQTEGPARSESMQAEAAWKNAAQAFERGVAEAKAQSPASRRDEKMKGLVTGMAERFVEAQPLVQVPRATEWAAQKALDWYETSPTGHAYRDALQADRDRWERADEGREAAYARHRENASRRTDIASPAVDADLSIVGAAPMPVRSPAPKPTVIDMSGDTVKENGKPLPVRPAPLTAEEKRAKLDAVLDMTGIDTDAQVDALWSNPKIQQMLTE